MKKPLLAALIAALVLTGCGASPDPSFTPSASGTAVASPSATASPSPTPSPSETATAQACAPWVDDPDTGVAQIGPGRFMGACVGQSFADAAANNTAVAAVEQCPWYGDIVSNDDLGFYVSAVSDPESPAESIQFFVVRWFSDPGTAAQYEMPRTAEGIGIGSTRNDVLAAYPDNVQLDFDDIARGPRSQVVVSLDDGTTYNFDITDNLVSEISWGEGLAQGGPNGDLCAL